MRANTREIVRRFVEIFDVRGPVLEVGALQVDGQEHYGDIRPFFSGLSYVGTDMRGGAGVDRVENFEGETSFSDGEFATIVSLDTVEHVYDIFRFTAEMDRVLAPGGLLLLVSVMYYPIHAHPYDYWRFTPETFRRLTGRIGEPLVLTQGEELFPHTVISVVRKAGELTGEERERFTKAVSNMPESRLGCAWENARETELLKQLHDLKSYHDQWGKVSTSGFYDFEPGEWRRERGASAFDPNLSRWYYVSLCWKNSTWLGNPIWQIPTDLMALQELISKVRPKTILETGTNRGGSALFFASMLHLLHQGGGRVVTVDVAVTEDTRRRLAESPFGAMIHSLTGSSTDPEIVKRLHSLVKEGDGPVLVFLDSDHSYEHVARELDNYHDLVTPGSYMVVFDTITRYLYDVPHGKASWITDNPLRATQEFLVAHQDFAADRSWERYMATFAPLGFLRRAHAIPQQSWSANRSSLEILPDAGHLRCVTFEGDFGKWGGLLCGCARANECDGATLPCHPLTEYTFSAEIRGIANWEDVQVVANVIDNDNVRLGECTVDLSGDWTALQLPVRTTTTSRHVGLQIVKVRNPTPTVFEIRKILFS